jgi:mannitol/fructose-specific phosphotransferase system IIA component
VGRLPAELPAGVLVTEAIRLGQRASDKLDALRQSGTVLLDIGAVEAGYLDAMLAREEMVTTFMGEGVAIPHGTNEARGLVHRTALGFLQFPDGVDWGDGATVRVCIPIAAAGGEHMALLSALAMVLVDPDKAEALRSASSADDVLALLASAADDADDADGVDEVDDAEDDDDPAGIGEPQASATEGVSS